MADLTRLRNIVLSGDMKVALTAAILYHLSPNPSAITDYGVDEVKSVVSWLVSSPGMFYGDVVAATGITPDILSTFLPALDDQACADAASLANAMATPDAEWDREHRNRFTSALAHHSADAARLAAQSSAEFAAVDAMEEAGYENQDHARTAVNELNRVYGNTYRVFTRQHARSRVAIAASFKIDDHGTLFHVLTPWCLSRTSAMIYVAVIARHVRRRHIEERASRLARTALTYAARAGLEAVRAIIEPAIAIVTSFRYDPAKIAFVDDFDRVRESITTRSPPTLVAFACVHMCGNQDVVSLAARLRMESLPQLHETPPAVAEYTDHVDDEQSALLMFSRVLKRLRHERDRGVHGPRLNKDPMLGYIARGVRRSERNTMACINRVEEAVSFLRSKGVDTLNTLFVIEWGGEFDYPTVMAALAVARLDVCVDIGPSGIDLPGADAKAEDGTEEYNYSLLLASAEERRMPRMPRVPYPSDEPLEAKLRRVAQFYSLSGSANIAYISGGVTQNEGVPVNICIDTANRLNAIRNVTPDVNVVYACAEALLPPLCGHGLELGPDDYLQCASLVDEDCPACNAHYRATAVLSAACADRQVRIVKPRSAYAHNGHLSLELVPGHPTCVDDTLLTVDSMVAANVLRNHDWGDEPVTPPAGGNPTSPTLARVTAENMRTVYSALNNGAVGPFDYDDMASIAASIAP